MVQRYYQGSPEEQMTLRDALSFDPDNAALQRERGISWAKRGLLSEWKGYDEAVRLDPINWIGWRGYMHLYYRRAIADFDALDTLTPGRDYPQATSDLYMRGVAYLMLEEYETALDHFDRWLAEETERVEEVYLGPSPWVYKAAALDSLGRTNEAIATLLYGLRVQEGKSAELQFYYGRYLARAGQAASAQRHFEAALRNVRIGYSLKRPYVTDFYEVEEVEIAEAMTL